MVDVPGIARQILSDMWEYGRIVLIIVLVLAAWGFVIGRTEDDREQSNTQGGLVLIGLGSIGIFALFSFLNVRGSNIITLIQARPAWGIFTSFVTLLVISAAALTAYLHFAANRRAPAISITQTSNNFPLKASAAPLKLAWSILVPLLLASIIWLWYIARG
jgi:hypothetical protein